MHMDTSKSFYNSYEDFFLRITYPFNDYPLYMMLKVPSVENKIC